MWATSYIGIEALVHQIEEGVNLDLTPSSVNNYSPAYRASCFSPSNAVIPPTWRQPEMYMLYDYPRPKLSFVFNSKWVPHICLPAQTRSNLDWVCSIPLIRSSGSLHALQHASDNGELEIEGYDLDNLWKAWYASGRKRIPCLGPLSLLGGTTQAGRSAYLLDGCVSLPHPTGFFPWSERHHLALGQRDNDIPILIHRPPRPRRDDRGRGDLLYQTRSIDDVPRLEQVTLINGCVNETMSRIVDRA